MQIDAWLKAASDDAERRGLPDLKPLLATLARSTAALRDADRSIRAATQSPPAAAEHRATPDGMDGE
jgi:hypothetical protein